MVGSSLAAKEHALKADVRGLKRQIGALAYELYGLIEDEIAVVEGG